MPSATQVRPPAPAPIDPSTCDPAESVPSRNVHDRHSLDALFAPQSSSLESADPLRYVGVFEGKRPETPFRRPSVPLAKAHFGNPVGMLLPALDAAGEGWSVARPESACAPSREPARRKWLRDACEQLENLDVGALDEGLEPPSAEARRFAERFILDLARVDLPLASVFADEDRSVSMQMEVTGFSFLLTCFEGGSGICNVAHQTYRSEGSYKGLSVADVTESRFLQHLRCLIEPLTKEARHADRPE